MKEYLVAKYIGNDKKKHSKKIKKDNQCAIDELILLNNSGWIKKLKIYKISLIFEQLEED